MTNSNYYFITNGTVSLYGDFTAAVSLCLTGGESVRLVDSFYRDGKYPTRDLPKMWKGSKRAPYRLWVVRRDRELIICRTLKDALLHADIGYQLYGESVSVRSIQG